MFEALKLRPALLSGFEMLQDDVECRGFAAMLTQTHNNGENSLWVRTSQQHILNYTVDLMEAMEGDAFLFCLSQKKEQKPGEVRLNREESQQTVWFWEKTAIIIFVTVT